MLCAPYLVFIQPSKHGFGGGREGKGETLKAWIDQNILHTSIHICVGRIRKVVILSLAKEKWNKSRQNGPSCCNKPPTNHHHPFSCCYTSLYGNLVIPLTIVYIEWRIIEIYLSTNYRFMVSF